MMLSIFSCCVSMIGCCGKCCSCCVVVFLSIYKFKIFVFCFGSWFISVYFCGQKYISFRGRRPRLAVFCGPKGQKTLRAETAVNR